MKKLNQSAIEYLGQWANDSMFDDYQCFYELGAYELCAIRLSGSGAIEENNNADEKLINAVAHSISFEQERKLIDEALVDAVIKTCLDCNSVVFVDESSQGVSIDHIDSCPQCLRANFSDVTEFNSRKKRGA